MSDCVLFFHHKKMVLYSLSGSSLGLEFNHWFEARIRDIIDHGQNGPLRVRKVAKNGPERSE